MDGLRLNRCEPPGPRQLKNV